MAGEDEGVARQGGKTFEGLGEHDFIAAGEIGTAHRTGEQGVPGEEDRLTLEVEANAPR